MYRVGYIKPEKICVVIRCGCVDTVVMIIEYAFLLAFVHVRRSVCVIYIKLSIGVGILCGLCRYLDVFVCLCPSRMFCVMTYSCTLVLQFYAMVSKYKLLQRDGKRMSAN